MGTTQWRTRHGAHLHFSANSAVPLANHLHKAHLLPSLLPCLKCSSQSLHQTPVQDVKSFPRSFTLQDQNRLGNPSFNREGSKNKAAGKATHRHHCCCFSPSPKKPLNAAALPSSVHIQHCTLPKGPNAARKAGRKSFEFEFCPVNYN